VSNLLTWLGPRRVGAIALTAALCTVASLTACGSNNNPAVRVARAAVPRPSDAESRGRQSALMPPRRSRRYTAKTGNKVDVVAVAEDQFRS
jgi:hypothetical protein